MRVVRQPTLRENGSILVVPGYDAPSGMIYWPSENFPEIPEQASRQECQAAAERLAHPFREVPFVEPVDRAVLLAEALTIATRHLYAKAPGFLHTAPEAGTGKSLAVDMAALVGSGALASNVSAAVLNDPTELRKLLTTWALTATPVGLLDDAERGSVIDQAELARFLTAGSYGDRVLGSNTAAAAPVVTTTVVTGNAIRVAGELVRRFLTIDFDAGCERPELRAVSFDIEAEIRRDRPELVKALLTLVRGYIVAGSPRLDLTPFGSFEDWSHWVRFPLVWAGLPDPCLTLGKHAALDEQRLEVAEVLALLAAVFGSSRFTATEVCEAVTTKMRGEAGTELRKACMTLKGEGHPISTIA